MKVHEQDPDENKLYSVDWSTWLQGSDTVASSAWTVGAVTPSSPTFDTTSTSVKLTGGVVGTTYTIVNTIVSAASLKGIYAFKVVMTEKGN